MRWGRGQEGGGARAGHGEAGLLQQGPRPAIQRLGGLGLGPGAEHVAEVVAQDGDAARSAREPFRDVSSHPRVVGCGCHTKRGGTSQANVETQPARLKLSVAKQQRRQFANFTGGKSLPLSLVEAAGWCNRFREM